MPVKWIITDIDGCLSPEESAPWNLDLFARLAHIANEANEGRGPIAPITLCTGRPQPYAEVLMKILGVRAPAVCENGAVLYSLHDNRSVYGPGVTEAKVRGLRAVRAYIESELMPAYPELVYQFGKEANMSIYCERPAVFAEITPRIEACIAAQGLPRLLISPTHYYLNINLEGVDKGKAIEALQRQLGVRKEETAGVGDTEGDLPLRNAVGFFACPANAKPGIKHYADYVSPYPDIEGMLDILARPEFRRAD